MTSTASAERPIRVVPVDDHRVVRNGVRAYLDRVADVEVVGEAGTGKEALERIASMEPTRTLPDVVLMDMVMPVLDGVSATRGIKQRWSSIEVIAMTSFIEESTVRDALEAGAAGYLLKDADAEEVAAAIRAAVAVRCTSTLRSPGPSPTPFADHADWKTISPPASARCCR